ncbi:hypothetical protein CONPUDRAFT_158539 [Coniophora puteana RWD-64-598 SS2]|uniref:F-box domain-containing protein n=1 Tax=Coniophora puteana (strain RWD-64-598) TaxID=741705 RepID=A0A5M3MBR6_CONPW|nr:uncharacterized protein CONPUDRAFT_158539 [Coniophora puteana RWD-64-598 SS2]EIW76523.1 hypothetical protein CONPUDRAFT_158539 [Coniophora puteana RWD-64-598 SS2]
MKNSRHWQLQEMGRKARMFFCKAAVLSRKKKVAYVHRLPVELILRIFGYLSFSTEMWFDQRDMTLGDLLVWGDNYPGAHLETCSRWRDIIWTNSYRKNHLLVRVGSTPTSLTYVRSFLDTSAGKPISVYVVQNGLVSCDIERRRSNMLMEVLLPSLDRIEALEFFTHDVNGLPHIGRQFCGFAPQLERLSFICRRDDLQRHHEGSLVDDQPASMVPLLFPSLRYVTLAGSSFEQAVRRDSTCLLACNSITIGGYLSYGPDRHLLRTSLLQTLRISESLTTLIIDAVDCSVDASVLQPADFCFRSLQELDLRYLGADAVKCFSRLSSTQRLSVILRSCNISWETSFPEAWSVTFQDVDKGFNVYDAVASCKNARELAFDDCAIFDRSLLLALSLNADDAVGHPEQLDCPHLESLSIRDCQDYSIENLTRVISKRMNVGTNFKLKRLHVAGSAPATSDLRDFIKLSLCVFDLVWSGARLKFRMKDGKVIERDGALGFTVL